MAILGPATFDIQEINAMYGRKNEVANWFEVEGFIGVGNFRQKDHDEIFSKMAIPMKINLIFFPKNLINIGINANYNINSLNNNSSAHLFLKISF